MKPHTVIVINAAFGFETCEEFSNLLRLPVSAFYTMSGPSSGEGSADVPVEEAEAVADTLHDLSELVGMAEMPEASNEAELRAWAKVQLAEIRRLVDEADAVVDGTEDPLFDTADAARVAIQRYANMLRAYDGSQD